MFVDFLYIFRRRRMGFDLDDESMFFSTASYTSQPSWGTAIQFNLFHLRDDREIYNKDTDWHSCPYKCEQHFSTLTFEQFNLLMDQQLVNLRQVLQARRHSRYCRRRRHPLHLARCTGTTGTGNRLSCNSWNKHRQTVMTPDTNSSRPYVFIRMQAKQPNYTHDQ